MNNHERYDELIVPYLYGELSEADERLMREHVKQCRLCADEAADFERIRAGMQETREPAPVLSASARRRVVKRAARELKPAWSVFWGIPELAVAATLLIAVFAGVFYMRHRSEMTAEVPGGVMEQAEVPPAVPAPRAVPTPARDEAFADKRDKMLTPDELKSRRRQDQGKTIQEEGAGATGTIEPSVATPPPAPAVGFSASNEVPSSEKDQEAESIAAGKPADIQTAAEPTATFATPPPASLERAAPQQQVGQDQIQLQSTTVPTQPAKEKKAETSGARAGGLETITTRAAKGAPSFEDALSAAADLETKGKRQEAAAAYRALIERFPEREKEILRSIKDQAVRQSLQPK